MLLKLSIIFAVLVVSIYLLRKNFRRSFYILWTGDLKPDWKALYEKWGWRKGEGKK